MGVRDVGSVRSSSFGFVANWVAASRKGELGLLTSTPLSEIPPPPPWLLFANRVLFPSAGGGGV